MMNPEDLRTLKEQEKLDDFMKWVGEESVRAMDEFAKTGTVDLNSAPFPDLNNAPPPQADPVKPEVEEEG